MEENYFWIVRCIRDAGVRVEQLSSMKYKLEFTDKHKDWCSTNPEVDRLRKNALRAIEDYYEAVRNYADDQEKKITDKIYDEEPEEVGFFEKLFKRRRHP